jgi:uncharacterized membrane protein YbhN (UPF0104 family)
VFIGALLVAPQWGADVHAVAPILARLDWSDLVLLGLAAAWNTVSYWFLLAVALPGLGLGRAAVSNQAATAVSSTAFGGGAVSAGLTHQMYRSWGFSTGQFFLAASVSGAWTIAVKLAVPPAALLLLHTTGGGTALLGRTAAIGSGLFAVGVAVVVALLVDVRVASALGHAAGRAAAVAARLVGREGVGRGWSTHAVNARTDILGLLQTRWRPLTVTAVISHLSLFVVLLASLRLVGVTEEQLPWTHVLAAFAFVELLSAVPITPGALGVAELGYAAALLPALDPPTAARVVAAVLLYRAVTYLPPIPIGAACYAWWRRHRAVSDQDGVSTPIASLENSHPAEASEDPSSDRALTRSLR